MKEKKFPDFSEFKKAFLKDFAFQGAKLILIHYWKKFNVILLWSFGDTFSG